MVAALYGFAGSFIHRSQGHRKCNTVVLLLLLLLLLPPPPPPPLVLIISIPLPARGGLAALTHRDCSTVLQY
jgi:energy-coupling factor transporter transmembrane protein EcfT